MTLIYENEGFIRSLHFTIPIEPEVGAWSTTVVYVLFTAMEENICG